MFIHGSSYFYHRQLLSNLSKIPHSLRQLGRQPPEPVKSAITDNKTTPISNKHWSRNCVRVKFAGLEEILDLFTNTHFSLYQFAWLGLHFALATWGEGELCFVSSLSWLRFQCAVTLSVVLPLRLNIVCDNLTCDATFNFLTAFAAKTTWRLLEHLL